MHVISVIITKEEIDGIPFTQFNDANAFITHSDYEEDIPNGVEYVLAETDYFGGSGVQSATAYFDNGNKLVFDGPGAINSALTSLGFVNDYPEDYVDLFEWAGLNEFRSNEELEGLFGVPFPEDIYEEEEIEYDDEYDDDDDIIEYEDDY